MNPEIEKTLSLIDEKINELVAAKKALISAFGTFRVERTDRPTSQPVLLMETVGRVVESTRKKEVIKLLQEKGPLTRSEIKNNVTFPEGTLSYVLLDKKLFENKDGKWHLVENKMGE